MLSFRGVTKDFGSTRALDGLDCVVEAGRRVGLLGRNGAGKTTFLRLVAGVLEPSEGEVRVGGRRWGHGEDGELGRSLGYLPETPPLYEDMAVLDYLRFAARLRGFDEAEASRRARREVPRCGLDEVVDRPCGVLSKGYRQRVGLAQALLHDPALLLLDEPTAGLDPSQVAETRRILAELPPEVTLVVSSHILSDVAATCDEIMILHEGRILAHDRCEVLARRIRGGRRLRLRLRGEAEGLDVFFGENFDGALVSREPAEEEGVWACVVAPPDGLDEGDGSWGEALVARLVAEGFGLRGLEDERADLAEIFRRHVDGDDRPVPDEVPSPNP